MGALSEVLGVDRCQSSQVADSGSDCHAVRASSYDGAGAPRYAGFNTCLEFLRTHDLLDSSH
jgi:hypothetical protein